MKTAPYKAGQTTEEFVGHIANILQPTMKIVRYEVIAETPKGNHITLAFPDAEWLEKHGLEVPV